MNVNIFVFSCITEHDMELFVYHNTATSIPASFPPTVTGIQSLDGRTFQPKSLPKCREHMCMKILKLVTSMIKTEKAKDQKVSYVYLQQWKYNNASHPRSHINKLKGTLIR